MAKETPPTEAQVAEARLVLQKADQAKQAEHQARLATLSELTASAVFQEVQSALEGLPNEMLADALVSPHLMAARNGMGGLAQLTTAAAAN